MTEFGKEKITTFYRIIVDGVLDYKWSNWFDGFTIAPMDNKQTELVGEVPDQAALHGVFAKIRDLGLTLVSVQQIQSLTPTSATKSSIPDPTIAHKKSSQTVEP